MCNNLNHIYVTQQFFFQKCFIIKVYKNAQQLLLLDNAKKGNGDEQNTYHEAPNTDCVQARTLQKDGHRYKKKIK